MTIGEFAEAVARAGQKYAGSITSWGRTVKRSVAVGGSASDPHTWWLGADMVYDMGPNRGDATHPKYPPKSCPLCSGDGLKVLHEATHDHYQPMDWVNKPHAQ